MRLVAKTHIHIYEIDYQKTFILVAKMNTVWNLLFLTANLDWKLQPLGVKNVFLHINLKEVYMEIPPKFIKEAKINKVCKLKKAPHKLK